MAGYEYYNIRREDFEDYHFLAAMEYYKSLGVTIDSSILNNYNACVNEATTAARQEFNFGDIKKEKEKSLEQALRDQAKAQQTPGTSLLDLYLAWRKYQQTIPFTKDAKEAKRQYLMLRNQREQEKYNTKESAERINKLKESIQGKDEAIKSNKERLEQAIAKRNYIVATIEKQFEEIDKILILQKALKGFTINNENQVGTRYQISFNRLPQSPNKISQDDIDKIINFNDLKKIKVSLTEPFSPHKLGLDIGNIYQKITQNMEKANLEEKVNKGNNKIINKAKELIENPKIEYAKNYQKFIPNPDEPDR